MVLSSAQYFYVSLSKQLQFLQKFQRCSPIFVLFLNDLLAGTILQFNKEVKQELHTQVSKITEPTENQKSQIKTKNTDKVNERMSASGKCGTNQKIKTNICEYQQRQRTKTRPKRLTADQIMVSVYTF